MLSELEPLLAQADYDLSAWQPSQTLDIGLHVDARGQWWHQGQPLAHPRIRTLFCRLLIKRGHEYFIKTPKLLYSVTVANLPLQVVDLDWQQGQLWALLQHGQQHNLSDSPSLRPFCQLDGTELALVELEQGVEAVLSRACFYRALAEAQPRGHTLCLGPCVLAAIPE